MIESEIQPTHKQRSHTVEAWLYTGQVHTQWPDWMREKFSDHDCREGDLLRAIGKYALRDEEGYFHRWMSQEQFNLRYEPFLEPAPVAPAKTVSGRQIELSHGGHVFVAERDGVHYFRFKSATGGETKLSLSVEASEALLELLRPGASLLERWIAVADKNGGWHVAPEPESPPCSQQ